MDARQLKKLMTECVKRAGKNGDCELEIFFIPKNPKDDDDFIVCRIDEISQGNVLPRVTISIKAEGE